MRNGKIFVNSFIISIIVVFALVIPVTHAGQAKNVILLIGDGYGVPEHTLSRLVMVGADGRLPMDNMDALGLMSTHSANSLVTDSAAAATAMASGRKVNQGAIGVTPDGRKLSTIMSAAMIAGKAGGVVSDTRITHATPAGFYAHVDSRSSEETIAEQLLTARPHVALGGGWAPFMPRDTGGWRRDEKDLLAKARSRGFEVVRSRDELLADDGKTGRLLGVFNRSHLDYVIDRKDCHIQPSLAEMTEVAIKRLSKNARGFFLVIEAGRIDHALHGTDVVALIHECMAFHDAIEAALNFAADREDTLVIVTADHGTGGMGISELLDIPLILDQKHSAQTISNAIRDLDEDSVMPAISDMTGIPEESFGPWSRTILRTYQQRWGAADYIGFARSQIAGLGFFHPAFKSQQNSTHGHTGHLVPLTASGPGAEAFAGFLDNTELPVIIAEKMGLNFPVRLTD